MSGTGRRSCSYRFLTREEVLAIGFASVGEDVLIHELANIVFPQNMHVGSHVRIDGFSNLVAGSELHIGSHVHLASFCHLSASSAIRIGDFSGISHHSVVYTASDDFSGEFLTGPTVDEALRGCSAGPVTIGRHVILGAGTIVFPGLVIGDGVAVGSRSLVTRPLEPWGLYYGTPAVRRKERSRRLLELEERMRATKAP